MAPEKSGTGRDHIAGLVDAARARDHIVDLEDVAADDLDQDREIKEEEGGALDHIVDRDTVLGGEDTVRKTAGDQTALDGKVRQLGRLLGREYHHLCLWGILLAGPS